MDLVLEGLKLGCLLAILVGPIFFTLIQTGVEQGFRAGISVGTGIWMSDSLFIAFVYFGVSYALQINGNASFTLWSGLLGAIILITFGIGTFISKAPFFNAENKTQRYNSYFSLWLKGFLINSLNPFTVFFWFSVMTSMVIENSLGMKDAMIFFGSIMFVIIATDTLKVVLSKKIRAFLKPIHVLWIRRITGILLVLFGIGLAVRVMVL